MNAAAHEVTVNTIDGSSFIFDIAPEESFQNLVRTIQEYENSTEEMQIFMTISANRVMASTSAYVKGKPRDFWTPLTSNEKKDITYILRTLANQTLLKINSNKTELKNAGIRIEHLHPLRFLTFVFSNDELIVCMRNLQGRTWVWSEFLEGVINSLKNEHTLGNVLDEHARELVTQAHVPDPNVIYSLINNQNWGSLINTLIAVVPRQTDGNRYDM